MLPFVISKIEKEIQMWEFLHGKSGSVRLKTKNVEELIDRYKNIDKEYSKELDKKLKFTEQLLKENEELKDKNRQLMEEQKMTELDKKIIEKFKYMIADFRETKNEIIITEEGINQLEALVNLIEKQKNLKEYHIKKEYEKNGFINFLQNKLEDSIPKDNIREIREKIHRIANYENEEHRGSEVFVNLCNVEVDIVELLEEV